MDATNEKIEAVMTRNDQAALTAKVGMALKKAFTEAVRRVYFWGLFVIASGFIFTLFLPEIALRKTHGHVRAGTGEGVAPAPGSAPVPGVTPEAAAAVSENQDSRVGAGLAPLYLDGFSRYFFVWGALPRSQQFPE